MAHGRWERSLELNGIWKWNIIPPSAKRYWPFSAAASNLYAGRSLTDLVAFLRLVVPVGVWKMDVAARLLHHPLDVVATFSDDVRVLCVGDVHLQRYPVALVKWRRGEQREFPVSGD